MSLNASEQVSLSLPNEVARCIPFRTTITDFDRKTILQTIAEVEKELKGCTAEINKLKATMIALESRRTRLESAVTRYRTLLAPINRLPPEVLAETFKECCPWPGEYEELKPSEMPTQVALSMVCAHWREVAVSSAALWSYFCVSMSWSMPEAAFPRLLQMVQMFVSRSKQHPLSIYLSCTSERFCPEIVELLVQNSHRWYDVELELSAQNSRKPVFRKLLGQLPSLEKLNLFCSAAGSLSDEFMDVFSHAPSLRSLELNSSAVSERLLFPVHQIKAITFSQCWFRRMYPVLPLFHDADRVVFNELAVDGTGPPRSRTVLNARHLSVVMDEKEGIAPIFDICTVPRLESLEVINRDVARDWDVPWDVAPLRECILRSSCSLTSLRLEKLPIIDDQMISLLQITPCLETLHIVDAEPYMEDDDPDDPHNVTVTTNFLRRLSAHRRDWDTAISSSPADHVVPRLKHLTLEVHSEPLDQQALIDVVTSRWNPDRCR
ncbi:hypothetical protein AAF712_000257 [Marasmius tenuissimus]|uniref:F-box domain-containing protein n=1 Tax=Marasmius tenuissimus TaxID=585030 RepID=A0ABR3AGD5_9AGAR